MNDVEDWPYHTENFEDYRNRYDRLVVDFLEDFEEEQAELAQQKNGTLMQEREQKLAQSIQQAVSQVDFGAIDKHKLFGII